jgi:Alpha/beta hydrolase domain
LDKHPGDLFSYDIFTQAGAAIRGDGKGVDPFQGLKVRRVIAMGESQAAGRMATYVNAVHPRARLYDGILIHSRGATPAPFGDRQPDVVDPTIPEGAQIRRDVDVPVLTFETEYDVDVLAFADARQPDSRNFRLWESAGTSHIDAYTAAGHSLSDLGDGAAEAALLDPTNASRGLLGCAEPINAGGQHAVLMAALSHLDRWVRDGTAPPKVPRLKTTGSGETIELVRDELGIARGGIRTPIVEVPLATNVGDATNTPGFCRVFGHTHPFDAATLAERYPQGSAGYAEEFDKAANRAVREGVWLEPDAEHYKAAAQQISFG